MSETLNNSIQLASGLYIPASMLNFSFARSSGPGGQNVNKLNTKAILTVNIDDLALYLDPYSLHRLKAQAANRINADDQLILASQEHRSQLSNKKACIDHLAAIIQRAKTRPRPRKKTKPSRAAQQRRLDQKKRRSVIKKTRSERFD